MDRTTADSSVAFRVRHSWANSDVRAMALAILADADTIGDEEPNAELRRSHLLRASSHMLAAYSELQELQRFPPRA